MLISVDCALKKSGIVVFDQARKNIHLAEDILIKEKKIIRPMHERLVELFEAMRKIFNTLPNNSHVLILEDRLTRVHIQAALPIESARTTVLLAYYVFCRENSLPYEVYYYTPNEIKYVFGGLWAAKKEVVHPKFREKYPNLFLEKRSEDVTDALMLAMYHLLPADEKWKKKS
jgi:Holliday junction resolvasome RuvABC endonuclease subunit